MAELPADLISAIEAGELTDLQLRVLIEHEARAIGLTYDEAVTRATSGTLPPNYISADITLLVDLLKA
jgi:hypothetical protein